MATINTHKPCGTSIVSAATFGEPPRFYDARGVRPLAVCPGCGRTLRERDLTYVRVYVAPRAAPRGG